MMQGSAIRHRPVPTYRMPTSPNRGALGAADDSTSSPSSAYETRPSLAQGNAVLSSLFWRALLGLLAFDILGFGRNFPRMHRFVSNWGISKRSSTGPAVDDVGRAVSYACAWYPKRVLCLQRSAVTTCLLRSCGVPAALVMGAQILPFKAHAWTEVQGQAVNEHRPVETIYTILERC